MKAARAVGWGLLVLVWAALAVEIYAGSEVDASHRAAVAMGGG